jgi:hypothetical protein
LSGPRFAAHCVYVKSVKGDDEEMLYLLGGDVQSGSPSRAAMIYAPELTSYKGW